MLFPIPKFLQNYYYRTKMTSSSSTAAYSQLSASSDEEEIMVATSQESLKEFEFSRQNFGGPKRKVSKNVLGHRTRWYIMVVLLSCLTLNQMNSVAYSFTVICMDDLVEEHHARNLTGHHWMESSTEKSLIFSATAIGAVMGLVPSVPLIDSLGIRGVLSISGAFSALGTLFFPFSVDSNIYAVIFCRVLQGLGVSVIMTVVGVIPGTWAPTSETGTFMAILSCVFQLSMIICMPVSGFLCESRFGWRSIYYIFGGSTIIFYAIFYIFYTDSPRFHRNVSEKELKKIEDGKMEIVKEGVPYWAICTDGTVLVGWLSVFGGNFGFTILTLYGPTYLKDVLNFDVKKTGFATALPFILSALSKFAAGRISDRMDFLTEKMRFSVCTIVSQGSVVIGLLLMAMTENWRIAQFAYTFAITASGLSIVGNIKCIQLRCRQHTHFALTVSSLGIYANYFGAPIVVGILTSAAGNTAENWSHLFIIVAVVTVITNAPFPFLTSDEPGPYVKVGQKPNEA